MGKRAEGRVVFISGGGAGIGRASAARFASEGAAVVIAEINVESGEKAAEAANAISDAGGKATFVKMDATDRSSVRDALAYLDRVYGRLDSLVNCVGGSTTADAAVDELSSEILESTLRFEVGSAVTCSAEAIPRIREAGGGTIVNFASVAAFRGLAHSHGYAISKGGIVSLTRAMAHRYARDSIRVNAIAPGLALTERAISHTETKPRHLSEMTWDWADYPFAIGTPEDIANIVLFLSLDESRMINGHTLMADGGLSVY